MPINICEFQVEKVARPEPNKTLIRITADGLKKAAEYIKDVLGEVLPIASQIVVFILKMAGI